MKVFVLTNVTEYFLKKLEELREQFPNFEYIIPKSREEAENELVNVDAIIGASLSESQIDKAIRLKYIFVPWTGVNELPIDKLRERKLFVSNSHGNGKIVAEKAVGLALTLLQRNVEYHNDLMKGIWHGYTVGSKSEDYWVSLQGKKVSILGFGTIGRHIAKLLSGFECEIMAYKKNPVSVDDVKYVTKNLEEALQFGKVIFLALPLTKETKGIINKENINLLEGKFLVNVGRGELIDEQTLYIALKDKILLGAAIDTWYQYPRFDENCVQPSKYPIHRFNNVVLSPHVAGFTIEGQVGRIDETIENLRYTLLTGKPKNIVNLDEEY